MLRYPLIALLAAGHMAIVTTGIFQINTSRIPVLGPMLDYYGSITGAKASYGFFAPEITGQGGVEFEVIDGAGHTKIVPLMSATNHEVEVRAADTVEQIAGMFMTAITDPAEVNNPKTQALLHSLAASLCGTVMGNHPNAHEVVFRLRIFTPISMSDYRKGLRSHWETVYEARFRREPPSFHPGGEI